MPNPNPKPPKRRGIRRQYTRPKNVHKDIKNVKDSRGLTGSGMDVVSEEGDTHNEEPHDISHESLESDMITSTSRTSQDDVNSDGETVSIGDSSTNKSPITASNSMKPPGDASLVTIDLNLSDEHTESFTRNRSVTPEPCGSGTSFPKSMQQNEISSEDVECDETPNICTPHSPEVDMILSTSRTLQHMNTEECSSNISTLSVESSMVTCGYSSQVTIDLHNSDENTGNCIQETSDILGLSELGNSSPNSVLQGGISYNAMECTEAQSLTSPPVCLPGLSPSGVVELGVADEHLVRVLIKENSVKLGEQQTANHSSLSKSGMSLISRADITCAVPFSGSPYSDKSDAPRTVPSAVEPVSVVEKKLKDLLPDRWFALTSRQGVQVGFRALQELLVVQRAAFFSVDGRVVAGVHGKNLPSDHPLWNNVKSVPLTPDTTEEFVDNVLATVNSLRSFEVCGGVEAYSHLWKTVAEDAAIDTNPYFEGRYSETCRSKSCHMLVAGFSHKRCSPCSRVWNTLRERNRTRPAENVPTHPKNKAHKYLVTPEKTKRLKRASEEISKIKRSNRRLQEKLDKFAELTKTEGENIADGLSTDFVEILQSADCLKNLSEVQQMIFAEQIKAASVKDPRGMKWHPGMIRIALAIRSASAQAYEELSGVLKLPSERTLFNYSHFIAAKDGINEGIIHNVSDQLNAANPKEFQRKHVLSADEMYIRKNLVYSKATGKMIGYANLNDVQSELAALDRLLESEVEGTTSLKRKAPIAEKILCYMVRGVANDVKAVVACFSISSLTKESFYFHTWEVIAALEFRRLQVIALALDGASCNHGFYQMHKPHPDYPLSPSGVVYVTINFMTGRPLFFLNDPAHLIKTCRNNMYYSGKKNKKGAYIRLLTRKNQKITWDTVIRLYNRQKDNTLKTIYKINQEDVYLNSFSMMKVPLAAHILSRSVAEELNISGWDGCQEFGNLCSNLNDFFDMVNGSHSQAGQKTRNPLLDPYRSLDDPRFQKLMETWQDFEDWKDEVSKLKMKPADKAKRIFSSETLKGLERTIRGFIGAVKFVLKEGLNEGAQPFINGKVFSSDDLEHFFSRLRGMYGSNKHPDLQQAIQGTVNLYARSKSSFRGKKKGNVGVSKSVSLKDISEPLPRAQRKSLNKS